MHFNMSSLYLLSFSLLIPFLIIYVIYVISFYSKKRSKFAIFHPYCNAGGGGERVLWLFVKHLRSENPDAKIVIYTGDSNARPEEIIKNARKTFQLEISSEKLEFVYLRSRTLVEARWYPFFTLLLQSLGSIPMSFEALFKTVPEIFIDTMGFSFTYPIFKYLARAKVVCYVHYPVISCDMLQLVSDREASFNNRSFISNSKVLTYLKLVYYQYFAKLYGLVGRQAKEVIVNSSWTKGHIEKLWKKEKIHLLYPPCNHAVFKSLSLENRNRLHFVSIAQFRPEKNHQLQLKSFASFLERLPDEEIKRAKLFMIGSCRNSEDQERVKGLEKLCDELGISDHIEFKVNIPFDELLGIVRNCNIGLHTMKNEHFGIGIVEMIAGGLIVVSHDSGGPKMDIIKDEKFGFLAITEDEYVNKFLQVVGLDEKKSMELRIESRKAMEVFGDENFLSSLKQILHNL